MARPIVWLVHPLPGLPDSRWATRRLGWSPPHHSTSQILRNLRGRQGAIPMEPDRDPPMLYHRRGRSKVSRRSALRGLWPPRGPQDPRLHFLTRILLANGCRRCHRARSLMSWMPILCQANPPPGPRHVDDPHHLVIRSLGPRPRGTTPKDDRRVHAPAGSHWQVLHGSRLDPLPTSALSKPSCSSPTKSTDLGCPMSSSLTTAHSSYARSSWTFAIGITSVWTGLRSPILELTARSSVLTAWSYKGSSLESTISWRSLAKSGSRSFLRSYGA